jgi:hypothetical protein
MASVVAKRMFRNTNNGARLMLVAPISKAVKEAPQRLGTNEASLTLEHGW